MENVIMEITAGDSDIARYFIVQDAVVEKVR
jgi:hypothetical protein